MVRTVIFGVGLIGVVLTSLFLGGCAFQKPVPDQVMERLTQATASVTSFHYNAELTLNGSLPIAVVPDVTSAQIKFSGDATTSDDPNAPLFTMRTDITGTSAQGNLGISGELANLSDYLYFRLTNLSLPTLLPISLGGDSRWYKIRHVATASPSEQKLGVVAGDTIISDQQFQALRNLISQTPVMEVLEVLPDATVNGQRSYHYKVQLKPESITELISQMNQLLNAKVVQPNLELIGRYQPEIWINKRTFQLSQFSLSDLYSLNGLPIAFTLQFGLSRQNESLKIIPPKDTEELDPSHLLDNQFPI